MLTIYKASAGAGKTYQLTGRYIDLLLSQRGRNRHRRILAVTFTKKATAEMKERIVSELSRLSKGEESKHAAKLKKEHKLTDEQLQAEATDILNDLLQDYGWFAVSTIDSFFQQILRSFAKELNLPGSYNLEIDAKRILQTAVDDYFFNLSSDAGNESVAALMRVVGENIEQSNAWNPKETILALAGELLKEKYQAHEEELNKILSTDGALRDFDATLKKITDDYLRDYRHLEEEMKSRLGGLTEDDFQKGTLSPFHWKEQDIADAIRTDKKRARFQTLTFTPEKVSKQQQVQEAAYRIQPLAEQLEKMLTGERSGQFLSARAALRYLPYLKILQDVGYFIRKANTELNRLPISETNALLRDVVSQQEESPFIYDKIGTRIAHYMIDEFQDTSAMQWFNFRPLVKESLSRGEDDLLVGDVKQSIYRWRNSDSGLLQYEVKRYFPDAKDDDLTENWRSNRVVVEENNKIFKALSESVQALYDDRCKSSGFDSVSNKHIKNIYNEVKQNPKKTEAGYVRIKFIENIKGEDSKEKIVAELPDLLRGMFARGIEPGSVALLIRKNKQAQMLADTLLAEGIKVVSNEGLLITSSPEVRLVLDILRLQVDPNDNILRLGATYEYALVCGASKQEALRKALAGEVVIPDAEQAGSLEEQVANIIEALGLNRNPLARPYLQAFQDKVYAYTAKYAADIYSFLDWWDKVGADSAIQMQQTGDAVQIVTIHKSKGLEYDVVIIPFCDWDSAEPRGGFRSDILWVEPKTAPYNRMPVLPVRFGSDLLKSVFRDDYLEELENMYVDNLNLTYVAFTRAKKELHVFAPYFDPKSADYLKGMGGLLHQVLKDVTSEGIYEKGEQVRVETAADEAAQAERVEAEPASREELREALRVKLPSRDYFFREKKTDLTSRVNLGNMMHEVLCNVRYWGDEKNVVDAMQREGRLTGTDLQVVKTELERFRELVADTDWFDRKWEVINEQDILLTDGTVRRPDRVIISGNEAMVIDYKFGLLQPEEYVVQVREYMQLLSEMGYCVSGWLCYVNLKMIQEVKL